MEEEPQPQPQPEMGFQMDSGLLSFAHLKVRRTDSWVREVESFQMDLQPLEAQMRKGSLSVLVLLQTDSVLRADLGLQRGSLAQERVLQREFALRTGHLELRRDSWARETGHQMVSKKFY
jgi:hypothetical protein